MSSLFRPEAIEHQRKRMSARSELLRISSGSTAWMFRILCARAGDLAVLRGGRQAQ